MRAAHDGADPRHEFVLVERLGQVVVGAGVQQADLVVDADDARDDHHRRRHLRQAQPPQQLGAGHFKPHWFDQDDVEVIMLGEIQAFRGLVGPVGNDAVDAQHEVDSFGDHLVAFDVKDAQALTPRVDEWGTQVRGEEREVSRPYGASRR